jgi:hypothetical protein
VYDWGVGGTRDSKLPDDASGAHCGVADEFGLAPDAKLVQYESIALASCS